MTKLPDDNDSLDLYQDAAGEWRWRVKAGNGQIIADSGEGYETRAGAIRASERVFPSPPLPSMAPVVTPRPAPPLGGLVFWVAGAFLLGFLVGLLIGIWVANDDGDEPSRPDPVSTTITTEVDSKDGTVLTDGKTSVLKNETTTTLSESPSGDPIPNTSTTEAP